MILTIIYYINTGTATTGAFGSLTELPDSGANINVTQNTPGGFNFFGFANTGKALLDALDMFETVQPPNPTSKKTIITFTNTPPCLPTGTELSGDPFDIRCENPKTQEEIFPKCGCGSKWFSSQSGLQICPTVNEAYDLSELSDDIRMIFVGYDTFQEHFVECLDNTDDDDIYLTTANGIPSLLGDIFDLSCPVPEELTCFFNTFDTSVYTSKLFDTSQVPFIGVYHIIFSVTKGLKGKLKITLNDIGLTEIVSDIDISYDNPFIFMPPDFIHGETYIVTIEECIGTGIVTLQCDTEPWPINNDTCVADSIVPDTCLDSTETGLIFDQDLMSPICNNTATNITDCGCNNDYIPNKITFEGVIFDGNEMECCYQYKSKRTSNNNCGGTSIPQEHFMMELGCNDDSLYNITSKHGFEQPTFDELTCMEGIKFDSECNGECDYQICIKYTDHDEQCCTKLGWYTILSGNYITNHQVQVPACPTNPMNPTNSTMM